MTDLQQLRSSLGARAEEVVVPPGLVDGAVSRGLTLRRRRRAVAVAGTALVAAAVAVPVVLTAVADSSSRPEPITSPSATVAPTTGPTGPTDPITPSDEPTNPAVELPLGAPPAIPYANGAVLVDGDLRLEPAGPIWDFAKVGDQYAVVMADEVTGESTLVLVSADGSSREIDRGQVLGVTAGGEGSGIALAWGWQESVQGGPAALKALPSLDAEPLTYEIGPGELPGAVWAVAPDGRVIFVAMGDPTGPPSAWDVETGTVDPLVPAVDEPGRTLVGLTRDRQVAVVFDSLTSGCNTAFDLGSGDQRWEHCTQQAAAISPEGTWLFDGIAVLDAETGAVAVELDLPPGGTDPTLAIWEAEDRLLVVGTSVGPGQFEAGPLLRCFVADGSCEQAAVVASPQLGGVGVVFDRP